MLLQRRLRGCSAVRASVVVTAAVVLGGSALTAVGPAVAAATPVPERRVIGYSVQHRPIVAHHLGNPRLERVDLIIGQMHGDEHAGGRFGR